MKNKIDIDGMIEAVEVLKDAQIELDEVITKIREAVRGTPVEGAFKAYTLPSLSMIAHEEDHEYMGRDSGNLDALMRELNEITEEQIALGEEEGDGWSEQNRNPDADGQEQGPEVVKGYHPTEELIHQPRVYTGAGVEIENPLYIDSMEGRKVGEKIVQWEGAPGIGRHVYLITRMDGSGVYGIKEGETGVESPDPTDLDPSRQVKMHDQPDRVRDVLTTLTDEELVMLRIACRPFDGHPGVDSKTIIYYKPDFLATALLGSVEDHARTVNQELEARKGMTAKGLSVAFDLLSKFEKAGFPGVNMEDLAHVEMERDDEAGREAYKADRKVIEG